MIAWASGGWRAMISSVIPGNMPLLSHNVALRVQVSLSKIAPQGVNGYIVAHGMAFPLTSQGWHAGEMISELNGWPACALVNASPVMLPWLAHDSGSGWVASPFPYGSFIRYSLPALTGAFDVPFSALGIAAIGRTEFIPFPITVRLHERIEIRSLPYVAGNGLKSVRIHFRQKLEEAIEFVQCGGIPPPAIRGRSVFVVEVPNVLGAGARRGRPRPTHEPRRRGMV